MNSDVSYRPGYVLLLRSADASNAWERRYNTYYLLQLKEVAASIQDDNEQERCTVGCEYDIGDRERCCRSDLPSRGRGSLIERRCWRWAG